MRLSKSSTTNQMFLVLPLRSRSVAVAHQTGAGKSTSFWFRLWNRGHKRPCSLLQAGVAIRSAVWLFLDQIKRDKGVWWMPWQQEAMKDVITCDKRGGAGNKL
jgi:hypothetical protein